MSYIDSLEEIEESLYADIENRLSPYFKESSFSYAARSLLSLVEIPIASLTSIYRLCLQSISSLFSLWQINTSKIGEENFSRLLKNAGLWKEIDQGDLMQKITLGHGNSTFLYGAASCTYQDSGASNCPDSNWAAWEKKVITEKNRSGKSADFFSLYKTPLGRQEIIRRLKHLGVNAYRTSIEWSHIQPEKNSWNKENLQVYIDLAKDLREANISFMVTLHHFSDPKWWGTFTSEEGVNDFLHFATKVSASLTQNYKGRPLVEYLCTINEPAIDAFSRHIRGAFPEGNICDFHKASSFLKGALKAHSLFYQKMKPVLGDKVQIGITHQYLEFMPSNALFYPITSYLTEFVNRVTLRYFNKGIYSFKMPFVLNDTDPSMPEPKADFVGLQYYVRPLIGFFGSSTKNGAPMTEMPFREDPEGLYQAAIKTYEAFKIPIIVTENGISTHDETQRKRYTKRAIYSLEKAVIHIAKNHPKVLEMQEKSEDPALIHEKIQKIKNLIVQGYFTWSISDNFEWDMGMNPQRFGQYQIDGSSKKGADTYRNIIRIQQESLKTSVASSA